MWATKELTMELALCTMGVVGRRMLGVIQHLPVMADCRTSQVPFLQHKTWFSFIWECILQKERGGCTKLFISGDLLINCKGLSAEGANLFSVFWWLFPVFFPNVMNQLVGCLAGWLSCWFQFFCWLTALCFMFMVGEKRLLHYCHRSFHLFIACLIMHRSVVCFLFTFPAETQGLLWCTT